MSEEDERFEEYADNKDEADKRAKRYRDRDPFPKLDPALLSSEHIKAYVRQTAMIHPFDDSKGRLKSASYEVGPGKLFIYWDERGRKRVEHIHKSGTFTLPANSISFVQVGTEFRLPQYMAVRFNLRITHVHRGLLLGTGPLVDPGFNGKLLVPLHNLTSESYTIRGDEGLIWIEFTKTSHKAQEVDIGEPQDVLTPTEIYKNEQPPEYYFDKANKNKPIQSSIPLIVAEANTRSLKAEQAAGRAERANRIFVGAGLLAIAGTVVGLFSFFESVKANVNSAVTLASTVTQMAAGAAADAKMVGGDAKRLQDDLKELKTQTEAANAATRKAGEEAQALAARLDEARAEIRQLQERLGRLDERAGTAASGGR